MCRSRARLALPLLVLLALPCEVLAFDEDEQATSANANRPRRPASDAPTAVEKFQGSAKNWVDDMGNRASVGLNGILTAVVDPVRFAEEGDEVFGRMPAPAYTGRVVGAFAGLAQMTYRVFTGTFDIAFSWVPFLYMQSPVPRVTVVPWAEHDDG